MYGSSVTMMASRPSLSVLDLGLGADQDAAAAGAIRLEDAGAAVDDAGGREIRAGHVLHQRVEA
jgi:hypothetical protein